MSSKLHHYRLTRNFYRKLWRKYVIIVLSFLFVFYLLYKKLYIGKSEVIKVSISSRTLLSELEESTRRNNSVEEKTLIEDEEVKEAPKFPPDLFTEEQRRSGFIVLHIAGMVYMFVALAIVCDEFFIPALDVITKKLAISEDVAGATFMAAGGSAPELFTSMIGVFITFDDVGIGTIVGSAVFNILFVLSMCAIFSKTVLDLTWWPLFRDVSFYSIILISLMWCFTDSLINWFEALFLLTWYGLYVTFMKYNETIEKFVKKFLNRYKMNKVSATNDDILPPMQSRKMSTPILHGGSKFRKGVMHLMINSIDPLHEEVIKNAALTRPESSTRDHHTHPPGQTTCIICNAKTNSNGVNGNNVFHTSKMPIDSHSYLETNNNPAHPIHYRANSLIASPAPSIEEEKEQPLDISWPKTFRKQLTYLSLAPIIIPLWITLPDVRKPEKEKWFAGSFIGSIIWIAFYSYLMVWWANLVGEAFNIGSEIMGLTFLAAGTSIPDLITSVLVARKGLGDMAVSSSIGSNIFDVTVGLPFPWFLYTVIFGTVKVNSTGMACSILILFLMLIFVIITIASFKWRLNIGMAIVMFFLYFIFIVVALILEKGIVQCSSILSII